LSHIAGLALALMSVVALVWSDIDDGRGGVSAGGDYRTDEKSLILFKE